MTDVIEGVAIYKNVIHMKCEVGYSFYGQTFKCGKDALIKDDIQCHASFECQETGQFTRKNFCETTGAAGKDNLVVKETVLINVPSGCEKIREYCPKLPPVSGFASDASCLHIAEGGEYGAECAYDCAQVKKKINYGKMTTPPAGEDALWNIETEPRVCLTNSEKLQCGHEGWTLDGASVNVVEGKEEEMHITMGASCLQTKNIKTCDIKRIWPDLRGDMSSKRMAKYQRNTANKDGNPFRSEKENKRTWYCGDALALLCRPGYAVADDPKTQLLLFECADTSDMVGSGKGLVKVDEMEFRRVSRNGELGLLFSDGDWGCQAKGCKEPFAPNWWKGAVAGIYTVVAVDSHVATLQCKLRLPQLIDHPECVPPKTKANWLGVDAGKVKVSCEQGEWTEPPKVHIDACASQIVNQDGLALSVNDNDDGVTWVASNEDDPKQRWARFDKNGYGLMISAFKPATFVDSNDEFTASCLGTPVGTGKKLAKCWFDNQENADAACTEFSTLEMVQCTQGCDAGCEQSRAWSLSSSSTSLTTCALSLTGPADTLAMGDFDDETGEEFYTDEPHPSFFLSPKATVLTSNRAHGMTGSNGVFFEGQGVPTLSFPGAKKA